MFTFSLHGAHNFPFRKEKSDLDVTFEDGAGDDEYLAALADHLPRSSTGIGPTWCSTSAAPTRTKAIGSGV